MPDHDANDWYGKDQEERDEREAKDEAAWAQADADYDKEQES
jgi:hypothetical protein